VSGAFRYAFVGAGWLLPWLRGELPPSRRRQTVCVAQILLLLVALAPIVTPSDAAALAAAGLVLLGWSFAVDVRWLAARRSRRPTE
jgi:hypothetical protein